MSSNAPLVGRLDRVPIRTLFPKEASSFTTYLEENIDYFAEQVGLKLSAVQREKLVGDFHLDLLCEDENERLGSAPLCSTLAPSAGCPTSI